MRVLVCGSRNWNKPVTIATRIIKLPKGTIVIEGGARGVDTIAEFWAKELGYKVEVYPAKWEKYGKSAGFKRNIEMLETGIDLVIAFWDGKSKGTRHTIREAEKRGIPVEIIGEDIGSI